MFLFDIETLDTESTTVVLSAALTFFDPTKKPSFEQLVEDSVFVKFDAKQQMKDGRTSHKETMEWWSNQSETAKEKSLKPSEHDVSAAQGLEILSRYVEKHDPEQQALFWARGSLDQMAIDSLARWYDVEKIAPYWAWRDVRTYVDTVCGTTNGYAEVDYPGFNRYNVVKHDPVHDCALDAMMIMYGKEV